MPRRLNFLMAIQLAPIDFRLTFDSDKNVFASSRWDFAPPSDSEDIIRHGRNAAA
jgi:hypothetical protein